MCFFQDEGRKIAQYCKGVGVHATMYRPRTCCTQPSRTVRCAPLSERVQCKLLVEYSCRGWFGRWRLFHGREVCDPFSVVVRSCGRHSTRWPLGALVLIINVTSCATLHQEQCRRLPAARSDTGVGCATNKHALCLSALLLQCLVGSSGVARPTIMYAACNTRRQYLCFSGTKAPTKNARACYTSLRSRLVGAV